MLQNLFDLHSLNLFDIYVVCFFIHLVSFIWVQLWNLKCFEQLYKYR